jgi:hypothetical protein
VAPVPGRIADREKDGFILFSSLRKSLFAPRIPVDRVMGVLQKGDFSLIRWLVYCDSSSGELLGPAAKEKGGAKDTEAITAKDRHRFESVFISSLLFERL